MKKNNKILIFEDRYFEVYGAQENLLILACELIGNNHEVVFVTTAEGALAEEARKRCIDVNILEAPAHLRTFEKGLIRGSIGAKVKAAALTIEYSRKLDALVKEYEPDWVVASSIRSSLLMSSTRLFNRKTRVLLFAQNSTPFGVYAAVATLGLERLALISSGSESTFPKWMKSYYSSKLCLLASGRDLNRYTRSDVNSTVDSRSLSIVTVCGISERKGLDVLIGALAEVQRQGVDCKLTVVGGVSSQESELYLSDLKSQAAANQLSIDWVGWKNDVVPFFHAADIFALTSRHEGLPGVIIEAMACGLPVVTTNAGGCDEIVIHEKTGYVVDVDDAAAVATALLLLNDEPQRQLLGGAGYVRAHSEYSTEAFYRRFAQITQN